MTVLAKPEKYHSNKENSNVKWHPISPLEDIFATQQVHSRKKQKSHPRHLPQDQTPSWDSAKTLPFQGRTMRQKDDVAESTLSNTHMSTKNSSDPTL